MISTCMISACIVGTLSVGLDLLKLCSYLFCEYLCLKGCAVKCCCVVDQQKIMYLPKLKNIQQLAFDLSVLHHFPAGCSQGSWLDFQFETKRSRGHGSWWKPSRQDSWKMQGLLGEGCLHLWPTLFPLSEPCKGSTQTKKNWMGRELSYIPKQRHRRPLKKKSTC